MVLQKFTVNVKLVHIPRHNEELKKTQIVCIENKLDLLGLLHFLFTLCQL